MNHPTEDELLLLAYDDLAEDQATLVQSHIAGCGVCRDTLARFERGRAALDLAVAPRRRHRAIAWTALALAAAAVIAGVLLTRSAAVRDPARHWTPTATWSATAGYVTGGKAMLDIDAQLTRLEQERHYGLPN
jgi:hypothetical protein